MFQYFVAGRNQSFDVHGVQDSEAPTIQEHDAAASTSFKHFPDEARTVLRPASEALLPQMSWSERIVKQLTQGGWIPGDIIGSVVPRLENGDFDWASASFYWKLFYWIDSVLGTDRTNFPWNGVPNRIVDLKALFLSLW